MSGEKTTRIPDRYASVERAIVPYDSLDEIEIIEVDHPFADDGMRVRLDSVPSDTIALDANDAAAKAIALQRLSQSGGQQLGYKVEFQA